MPQTTVNQFPDSALEGMLDGGRFFGQHAVSAAVETAAGVGPGRLLLQGASEGLAKIPAGDIAKRLGFTIYRPSDVEGGASVMFAQYAGVSLLRVGRIWLHSVGALAVGDTVAILHTGTDAGRPCVSGTANSTVLPGIEVVKGATDGLALFEINLP